MLKKINYFNAFTLIELLVSTAIIGILAALSVENYNSFRSYAYEAAAISDMHNVVIGQEARYVDTGSYVLCLSASTCRSLLPGLKTTKYVGITSTVAAVNGVANQAFGVETCSTRGFVFEFSGSTYVKRFSCASGSGYSGKGIFSLPLAQCESFDD